MRVTPAYVGAPCFVVQHRGRQVTPTFACSERNNTAVTRIAMAAIAASTEAGRNACATPHPWVMTPWKPFIAQYVGLTGAICWTHWGSRPSGTSAPPTPAHKIAPRLLRLTNSAAVLDTATSA